MASAPAPIPPTASAHASVFRRGGQKKELFFQDGERGGSEAASGIPIEDADRQALHAELAQLLEVLTAPKIGRDWSAAIWRPNVGAAELVLSRRGTAQSIGYKWRRRHWLHIEEALFLMDRSDLLLFVEQDNYAQHPNPPQPTHGPDSDTHAPGSSSRRRRLLSLQEGFELMVLAGVPMERYWVYSQLSRTGFLVMRYPSCWVLPDDLTPGDVWGHGAWQGCCGCPASVQRDVRAMHQGVAPQALQRAPYGGGDGDEADEGAEPQGSCRSSAGQEADQPQQQAEAPGVAMRMDSASCGVQDDAQGCRSSARCHGSWWPRVPGCDNPPPPPHPVDLPASDALRAACPRLRPLQPPPDGTTRSVVLPGDPACSQAHLVFDVYRPGAHVARAKRVFPTLVAHVAMCSARPPRLHELRAADAQALAPTVPIKWASVEGGIVLMYELGPADLLCLL